MVKNREVDNMIEIENAQNRNLKNIKQIGTPKEENKIYIENMAYNRMSEEHYRDKQVFVLMGHTEHMDGRYATFIEAVIPVREIEFIGNTPVWGNHAWSEVFREIKRLYEDMIIVGWAFDSKGMPAKITPELERMHREHFGGVHQLLFLIDTLEHEEIFYIYKENKLVFKDGFYIYHKARKKEVLRDSKEYIPVKRTIAYRDVVVDKNPEVDVELVVPEKEPRKGGKYRQMIVEQKTGKKDGGNKGIAVAVAMLVFILGVSFYENSETLWKALDAIETGLFQNGEMTEEPGEEIAEDIEASELESKDNEEYIEIEIVPGGE